MTGERGSLRRVRYRLAVIALPVGALLAATALSLSDRVPVLARRYGSRVPGPDWARSFSGPFGVHFFAWAALTFVTVLLPRRWATRVALAAGLVAASWVIELLQDRFSSNRSYEDIDLAANVGGVLAGFAAASVLVAAGKLWKRRLPADAARH